MTFDQWADQYRFDRLKRATAKLAWDAGYKASEEEFHAPLGAEPLPPQMLEALDITRDAVDAQIENNATIALEALALLRELNDALVIPGWLQPRVDAVLDRAEAE